MNQAMKSLNSLNPSIWKQVVLCSRLETPQEDMLKRFKKVLDQHVEMINRYEDNANDAMVDSWNESPFQEGYHINLALSK